MQGAIGGWGVRWATVFLASLGVACAPDEPRPAPDDVPASEVGRLDPEAMAVEADDDLRLDPEIRSRVEAAQAGAPLTAGGEALHATQALFAAYRERAFEPIWLEGNRLLETARELLDRLRTSERDGLNPDDYHLQALDSLIPRLGSPADVGAAEADEIRLRSDVDLLLTDAFLLMASHLLHGRLDPVSMEPAWTASRNGMDLAGVLLASLRPGGVAATLERLQPTSGRYGVLRDVMARFREIAAAGGWDMVPPGETLEPGMSGPRVAALRARLEVLGDSLVDPDHYDEALADVVREFQRRHGLVADGRVGTSTLAAMNVPVEERLDQLLVNLERWRWLPSNLGTRYILVNIPAFTVHVVEDGEEVLRTRAIVGRAYRQTPVFSGRMTYLSLAPYWNVPPGIAANDQLPRIRADPGYVAEQRMVLFENATNRIVDPHSVDWSGMTGSELNRRFRLRQEPGPQNALGQVKFMFPNRHNVYLHDTPAQELFSRAVRDFSSGCIRVEGALELAAHLLREDPAWTPDRIRAAVRQGREQSVTLPRAYDVHLQYWTAWVEADGSVQFRSDIYDRDARVREALRAPPPRPM